MSAMGISMLMFVCVFGGALCGMLLRATLPQHHLSADSTDIVKLGTGLVATMSALILALLTASTKSSYDTQRSDLTQMAVNVVLLDRALASYGSETWLTDKTQNLSFLGCCLLLKGKTILSQLLLFF